MVRADLALWPPRRLIRMPRALLGSLNNRPERMEARADRPPLPAMNNPG